MDARWKFEAIRRAGEQRAHGLAAVGFLPCNRRKENDRAHGSPLSIFPLFASDRKYSCARFPRRTSDDKALALTDMWDCFILFYSHSANSFSVTISVKKKKVNDEYLLFIFFQWITLNINIYFKQKNDMNT